MREPRDRAQRIPESRRAVRTLREVAERFEAVAFAIDRMPHRNERSRFGKEQKQHAVDDGEGLFEAVGIEPDPATPAVADEGAKHISRCVEYTGAQRFA